MAFLEGLSSKDLGIAVAGEDFIAVQDHSEESRQSVAYRKAYGSDAPILRTIEAADEDTLSFTAVVLKSGAKKGLHQRERLKKMRDFEAQVRYGDETVTHRSCNWTRIGTRGSQNEVILDCDISIPGFSP